jgi:hypothetical protein
LNINEWKSLPALENVPLQAMVSTIFMSATLTQIPVIDFASFSEGNKIGKQKVANQINTACREIGFFYLKPQVFPQR